MRCDVSWDGILNFTLRDALSLRYLEIRYGKTLETQRYLEIQIVYEIGEFPAAPYAYAAPRRAAPRRAAPRRAAPRRAVSIQYSVQCIAD